MSAPFFVTRSGPTSHAPIATLEARDLGEAETLATAMYGRFDPITGTFDTSGLVVWHQCQAPQWWQRARVPEKEADRADVVTCIKLHWRRFFDRAEKHNH